MDKNNCGKPQFGGAASDSSANRVKLTDVVWFQEGPGVRNYQYTSHGVKLLNVANLHEGKLDTSNTSRYISDEEAYGRYKHFLVDEGDLIVASSGIKVEYFDQKMGFADKTQLPLCMNTSTIRFKARSPHELDINYFMCYLKSDDFKHQLERQITGSAQLNFGPSHLKRMSMPLPPLAHQLEVAERIAYIDKQIDDARTVLSGLDNLVKSRFIEMFGDPNSKRCEAFIEDAFFIRDDLRKPLSGKERDAMKTGELYPYYGANGKVDDINQFLTDCDALCFAEDCGSYGPGEPTAYVIRGKAWVNNHAHLLVAKCPHFLEYARTYFTLLDINRFISGTTRAKMTQAQLKKVNIEVPDQVMLREFEGFVSNVDKLRFDVQQQIDKLELFKNSLMQEYFG